MIPCIEKCALPVVFPFRLDLTVWALRRRSNNRIDRWDGREYRRVVVLGGSPVEVSLAEGISQGVTMGLRGERAVSTGVSEAAGRLMEKMLRPGLDLSPFYALAENDEYIGPLVRRFRGVKPPRFPAVFEALVNAVACQQVSLDVGIILLNRLAERFGPACGGGQPRHAFPGPEGLADVPAEEIKKLGFSYKKAQYIKGLAMALVNREVDLAGLEGMANTEAVEHLTTLRGIGRWSAEYVLLRGLGRLDIFPGDDVGAQNNLRRLFRLDHRPGYEEIKKLTSRWHPYEGIVYFHLLLNKLELSGVL